VPQSSRLGRLRADGLCELEPAPYSSFTSAKTDATDSFASPNSSAVFSL
jgi:hypothetical protein